MGQTSEIDELKPLPRVGRSDRPARFLLRLIIISMFLWNIWRSSSARHVAVTPIQLATAIYPVSSGDIRVDRYDQGAIWNIDWGTAKGPNSLDETLIRLDRPGTGWKDVVLFRSMEGLLKSGWISTVDPLIQFLPPADDTQYILVNGKDRIDWTELNSTASFMSGSHVFIRVVDLMTIAAADEVDF
jgi:hypothetical protein